MKKNIILMIIGMLVSFNALAMGKSTPQPTPTASDSWDTIRQDVKANWSLSLMQTDYAASFGDDGFFNACVDGSNLRSIKPLSVCLDGHWEHHGGGNHGDDNYVCDQYGNQNVVLPLQQSEEVCTGYKHTGGGDHGGDDVCVGYQTVIVNLPTTPMFTVWTTTHHNGREGGYDSDAVLFSKAYQIPACN